MMILTRTPIRTARIEPFARTIATSPLFSTTAAFLSTSTKKTKKPRVVILGSGWAGNTLARRLDKQKYDVRLISPANHFLFTSLLPSTAVGTLEFRAIQEPVRTIAGLGEYYQAKALQLGVTDEGKTVVHCADLFKGHEFPVRYDYLVVAAGNKTNTFQTPGIAEREGKEVFFLKHLYHARQIRNRVLECFERASNPNITDFERDRLLSFVIVGGGPTSCEFTTELYDFLQQDVVQWYPDLMSHVKVTLVEAGPGLLGSFHQSLADYYLKKLKEKKIDVRLSMAVIGVELRPYAKANTTSDESPNSDVTNDPNHPHRSSAMGQYTVAQFADGTELPFGTMVWSAGLAPVRFVKDSGFQLQRGRIVVDEYLRVPDHENVFALGDCAALVSGPLPPTASVAEQQAYYLADCFNKYYYEAATRKEPLPLPGPVAPALMPWKLLEFLNPILCKSQPEFTYKNRGMMAGMGFGGGVTDLTNTDLPSPKTTMSGTAAFVTWRTTYLTKQLSWKNMMLIPMYWFKAMVFGRDISRF
ncbi:hypothetical protein FisN_19Lh240 [Fistulifera solaris]|uniref:NADH:ubiquinone reductase (non-electrogenic) n=1 Tax=Fistulifera solaris TaxID=1519565 RepID=A0A1Z5K7D6_FISSO|nr:hypothetical protein FisN_19Lh240 [Fistulifera solaris]|eukprot:GAX22180.1 hypothetical protein FisN_19Lh240 [Fistulifera solaris]